MSLRELTHQSHKEAEAVKINQDLIYGRINHVDYTNYLFQRFIILKFLDTFMPIEFSRAAPVFSDLSKMCETHNINPGGVLKQTVNYLTYLIQLSSSNRQLIDAHIYVNYLGDLYGGQIIRNNNLDKHINHLHFRNPKEEILYIRSILENRDEELAEEANKAFAFIKEIYEAIPRSE